MTAPKKSPPRTGRAAIPSMTALLAAAKHDERFAAVAQSVVTAALRAAADEARASAEKNPAPAIESILAAAANRVRDRAARRLTRVVNATGVVLHTNLGRAPLAPAALNAVAQAAAGYSNLELDLFDGRRGRRAAFVEQQLMELTGAEAALAVNNNAAATLLVLSCLAAGREVIVSRGQLIEIGGSFRLPDVMAAGGATLREVGTTNRTRLADYEAAVNERTALIMRVHTSNYRVVGFADAPAIAELASLARHHRLPLYDDLGSGALCDHPAWQSAGEPSIKNSLRDGADIVSFSGDKLLGGPQAGLVLGRRPLIEKLRAHPMARALRIDKLTIAALEATLDLYQSPGRATREIPALAMLQTPLDELRTRAESLAAKLRSACPGQPFEVAEETTFAGGGSLPAWPLPTFVVRWVPANCSPDDAAQRLRDSSPPIIVRLHDNTVIFDTRTLSPTDEATLVAALRAAP